LIKYAQLDRLEEVQKLVESSSLPREGVEGELNFFTALGMAVWNDADNVVRYLLSKGAKPNHLCATPGNRGV
jgi:hypothetical protein